MKKEYWNAKEVMAQLGVSRPTAYRLMENSGAQAPVPRRHIVEVDAFKSYLKGGGHADGRQRE